VDRLSPPKQNATVGILVVVPVVLQCGQRSSHKVFFKVIFTVKKRPRLLPWPIDVRNII